MKKIFLTMISLFFLSSAYANCRIDISNYVGWTIIYAGKVTGYVDEKENVQDSFEGCEYDRILILDDSKQVICQTYSYSYAYRPDIVIMKNGFSVKACIGNKMYDISL